MKFLISLLLLVPLLVKGQSPLPLCPEKGLLHNCVGVYVLFNGSKQVGEFKNNQLNGQGVSYDRWGTIIFSGTWKNDQPLESDIALKEKYPFNLKASLNSAEILSQYQSNLKAAELRLSTSKTSLPQCPEQGYKNACYGSRTESNGNKYEGEFLNDKYHGRGKYQFLAVNAWQGQQYEGEFKEGKRNGQGTLTFTNGEIYVGEFRDDKRNGQGTNTFANGNKYVGEYKDDKKNGQGTLTFTNGEIYVGEFRDDKRNGQGTETFATGIKYVGEYKDDKRNGQGTYTFADGSKYVGEVKDGKRNGQGIEYSSTGYVLTSGQWDEAKLIKVFPIDAKLFPFNSPPTDLLAASANLPKCPEQGIKNNCFGTMISTTNRVMYEGEFQENLFSGKGIFTFINGDKYVGEFWRNLEHGQGILYDASGNVIKSGQWKTGSLAQSVAIDANRFPFNSVVSAAPNVTVDKLIQAQVTKELEETKRRQKELEEQLARERQERERLSALVASQTQQRPQTASPRNERRIALVIGNSAYKVSPLDNPSNDASDIADSLRRSGFNTTLIRNASLGQMRDATRKFADQLPNSDVALIYFAGHGIESGRKNFMIPVNADIKFEYELSDQAYDASIWLDMLEGIKSSNADRVNIVILDACRNNSLIGSRSLGRGLGKMDAPAGTFLAYSTSPGKVAADGVKGDRNSPFTKHLLKAMGQPGVPIEEVFKEVRRNVVKETSGAQIPWESTSLTGFFAFTQTK